MEVMEKQSIGNKIEITSTSPWNTEVKVDGITLQFIDKLKIEKANNKDERDKVTVTFNPKELLIDFDLEKH